jgi:hypothetical protein
LHEWQVIAFDPELMNRIWYLKGKPALIGLDEFYLGEPTLERVSAHVRPDITRDLIPNPPEALFHN